MLKFKFVAAVLFPALSLFSWAPAHAVEAQAPDQAFIGHMQVRIQALRSRQSIRSAGQQLSNRRDLVYVYDRTGYQAIWTTKQGWNRNARRMLDYLHELPRHGLSPEIYHYKTLQELSLQNTLASRVHSELLLSDASLSLGSDLARGASTRYSSMAKGRRLLLRLKPSDDPGHEFDALLPQHEDYWRLTAALRNLLASATEDSSLPRLNGEGLLRATSHDAEVAILRERLIHAGFVSTDESTTEPNYFSEELKQALSAFQASRGLDDDGILGPGSRAALNQGTTELVAVLSANLERWRQLSPDYGEHHIRVNTAAQQLEYVHAGKTALKMSVIVGRSQRQTPSLQSAIREIVFNPYWEVPTRIAVRDKLPVIRKNPGYLEEKNFIVRESWAPNAAILDPSTIDWENVTAKNFAFRISQKPGPDNALGAVKFLFPNDYTVYLHDTSAPELFDESQRLFSSGCVRLSKPMELAEQLLAHHGSKQMAIDPTAEDQRVYLEQAVPVHLEYWTAWVDDNGELQHRSDVYQRDESILTALNQNGSLPNAEALIAQIKAQKTQLASHQP